MALQALADYDSSSSDDDAEVPCKRARTDAQENRLPSPPLEADDDDAVAARHDAAATDGLGRVRQFGHVDGHYAVHVFLPVAAESSHVDAALRAGLGKAAAALAARSRPGCVKVHALDPDEYHISLSRTVMLPQAQIEPFADALRVALRPCRAAARVPLATRLCELANDTQTRFFAAVEVERGTAGHATALTLVDAVDRVMARYGQPQFYAERRLHFSIAWAAAPLSIEQPEEAAATPAPAHLPPSLAAVRVDTVLCRIGERMSSYRLAS